MADTRRIVIRSIGRRIYGAGMSALTGISILLALTSLLAIVGFVVINGFPALNSDFFLKMPTPVGVPGGGIANAIVGSLIVIGLATIMSVPIGLGAGVYLSEFGRNPFGDVIRYLADVLSGVPSIVMGIFGYALIVTRLGHFSALAGGFSLAVMMLPSITRTTEEMLKLVPENLREGALALGAPRWRAIVSVVIPAAGPGVLTGIVLGIARVAGETAPLLFTAFGNLHWSTDINQPIATLPQTLYYYAISPYDEWRAKAWGAAVVLAVLILITSTVARIAGRRRYGAGS